MQPVSGALRRVPTPPHERVRLLLRAGRNAEAVAALRDVLAAAPADLAARKLLFDAYFQGRDWPAALAVARSLAGEAGDTALYRRWIINTLSNMGSYREAAGEARAYLSRHGEDAGVLNTLKIACFYLGDTREAIECGQKVMEIRDREAVALGGEPVGAPAGRRGKDVIGFTLWGGAPVYCYGAMINLLLARRHYPGWVCRFFVDDSVPRAVVAFLEAEGGEIVSEVSAAVPGYVRRFLPFDDATVARVLVRDCDSRLAAIEARAVAEWQDSGRAFHVIRDHVLHNDLMLAGLWGGRADCGLAMSALLKAYFGDAPTNKYGHDQRMLARMVWPRIRAACLVHDKFYSLPGVATGANLPRDSHLGAGSQNLAAVCREAESLGLPRIH